MQSATTTNIGNTFEKPVSGHWGLTYPSGLTNRKAKVVRNGDIDEYGNISIDTLPVRWFTASEIESSEIRKGDSIIVSSGNVGKTGMLKNIERSEHPVICSNFVLRIRPLPTINCNWLNQILRSKHVQQQFRRYSSGTAILNISKDFSEKIFILTTQNAEWENYSAEILDDFDSAISNKLISLSKQNKIKSGLLNSLVEDGIKKDTSGWKSTTLGDVLKERKEQGDGTLPLYSVTLHRGLVPRSEMNRHISSEMAEDKNAIARKGDLAYNMMRMWQGGSGIAEEDCLVSPAYVVCRPTKEIDSNYLRYLVKSDKMLRQFIANSEGVAKDRWRLYYRNLAPIEVDLPPIDEQREIARILMAQDEVISKVELEIKKLRSIKQDLVNVLLFGRKSGGHSHE